MATKGKAVAHLDALVFIDTNIFLDFYRVRGWESGLSVLNHIAANHDRIITGCQVEMEFKKNRQKVILDSLGKTKSPEWGAMSIPTFLQESRHNRAVERARKQVDDQVRRIRSRIEAVLKDPSQNDPVFRVAQALFRASTPFNLTRDNDAKYRIRRLAAKRFLLGYPPRKEGDTSIGDAINWEWLVRCAIDSGKHVILVSRDSDYGHGYQKSPVLNDWLRSEFADRTSKRRKIILTDRLTDAFKRIAVPVTEKEVKQEEELVAAATEPMGDAIFLQWAAAVLNSEEHRALALLVELQDREPNVLAHIAKVVGKSTEEIGHTIGEAIAKLKAAAQAPSKAV